MLSEKDLAAAPGHGPVDHLTCLCAQRSWQDWLEMHARQQHGVMRLKTFHVCVHAGAD